MAVTSTQTRAGYVGNGVTQTFGFGFAVTADSDITVTVTDTFGATSTPDFTVNRAGFTVGGEITLSNGPLASLSKIAIVRSIPVVQQSSFNTQSGTYLKTIEDTFDRQTMMIQEANAKSDKMIALPDGLAAQVASNSSALSSLATTVSGKADSTVVAGKLDKSQNLSDVASVGTARTNLGLGTAAQQNAASVNLIGTMRGYIGGSAASATNVMVLSRDTLANLVALPRLAGAIYFATDTLKEYVDTGAALVPVGSGSSSGGINYVTNPDAETDTSGWSSYSNTAGTSPVTGSGGTSLTTWTRETVASGWMPIRGTGSFMLSKPAANRQGDGSSFALSIDKADQGKVLQLSLDYAVASGTYDGLVSAWLYDITNAKLIAPMDGDGTLPNHLLPSAQYLQRFQTSYNSTSYRLILHVASPSTTQFSLYVDNVSFGPQTITKGFSGYDATPVTMTLATASGTPSNYTITAWETKLGDRALYYGKILFSAAPAAFTGLQITLPTSRTIDTSKLAAGASQPYQNFGTFVALDAGVQWYAPGSVQFQDTSRVYLIMPALGSNTSSGASIFGNGVGNTFPFAFGAGDEIEFNFEVPIKGWSSNVAMSSDVGTPSAIFRVTGRSASGTTQLPTLAGTANGVWQAVTFGSSAVADNVGGYANGIYTVKKSTYFDFEFLVGLSESYSSFAEVYAGFKINGAIPIEYDNSKVSTSTGTTTFGYSQNRMWLAAGTTIQPAFYFNTATGNAIWNDAATHYFTLKETYGTTGTIAATETIVEEWCSSAGQSFAIGNVVGNVFKPATKTKQTHGVYNPTTGEFTPGRSGSVTISGFILPNASWGTAQAVFIAACINGTTVKLIGANRIDAARGGTLEVEYYGSIDVLSTDKVTVRLVPDIACTAYTDPMSCWVRFEMKGS